MVGGWLRSSLVVDHQRVDLSIPVVFTVSGKGSCEFSVQVETTLGERAQRRAITPVTGEKAARLARGSASNITPFDKRYTHTPEREEIGYGCTDDTGATNCYVHLVWITLKSWILAIAGVDIATVWFQSTGRLTCYVRPHRACVG